MEMTEERVHQQEASHHAILILDTIVRRALAMRAAWAMDASNTVALGAHVDNLEGKAIPSAKAKQKKTSAVRPHRERDM